MINLGNVVGLLKSATAPVKTDIIWAKILNIAYPNVVRLHYYDNVLLDWYPFDASLGFYLPPVKAVSLNTPPDIRISGDSYIIGAAPTDAWIGKPYQVATWTGAEWTYIFPKIGARSGNISTPWKYHIYTGDSTWTTYSEKDPSLLVLADIVGDDYSLIQGGDTVQQALDKLQTQITDLILTGDFVAKAGDEMTGNLSFSDDFGVTGSAGSLKLNTTSTGLVFADNSIIKARNVLFNFSGSDILELTTDNGGYAESWLYMNSTNNLQLGFGINYLVFDQDGLDIQCTGGAGNAIIETQGEMFLTGHHGVLISAEAGYSVDISTNGDNHAKLKTTNLTGSVNIEFPNASGTFALTTDISDALESYIQLHTGNVLFSFPNANTLEITNDNGSYHAGYLSMQTTESDFGFLGDSGRYIKFRYDGTVEVIDQSANSIEFPGIGINGTLALTSDITAAIADYVLLHTGNVLFNFYSSNKLGITTDDNVYAEAWITLAGTGVGENASLGYGSDHIIFNSDGTAVFHAGSVLVSSTNDIDLTYGGDFKLNGTAIDDYINGLISTEFELGLQWVKITKTFADFSSGSMDSNFAIYTLVGGWNLHAVRMKHSVAFSGGSVASMTISIGLAGNVAKYASAFDVFQAVAHDTIQLSQSPFTESQSVNTTIIANCITTGANLSALTAGSIDIWLLVSPTL